MAILRAIIRLGNNSQEAVSTEDERFILGHPVELALRSWENASRTSWPL